MDALYRPAAGKPLVLEDLCFGMGTSVASTLTAETIFEIMKCISDVDMPARGRMGSKCEIFQNARSVGRSAGRSVLNITLFSYTPLRYVRNVAREE